MKHATSAAPKRERGKTVAGIGVSIDMSNCSSCRKCQTPYEATLFTPSSARDGRCAKCFRATQAAYRERNRERIREYDRAHRDPSKSRQYYQANAEERRAASRRYYAAHIEECRAKNRIRMADPVAKRERNESLREKRRTDPLFRLQQALRLRMRKAIQRYRVSKAGHSWDLVGCSVEQLRDHLESLWLPGMSWENHGTRGWHIDHILPCASFELANPTEQRKCFHWSNMQPLWATDNLSKKHRIQRERVWSEQGDQWIDATSPTPHP